MALRKKFWILLFLTATLAGVIALSSGISDIELSSEWKLYDFDEDDARVQRSTATEILNRLPRLPAALWQIFSVMLVILMPMAIVVALFSPEIRKTLFQEIRRAVPFIVMAVAILYLVNRIDLEKFKTPGDELLKTPPDAPSWITNPTVVAAFLIGVLMIGGVFVFSYLIWQRSKIQPLDQLADEAQAAVDHLRAGADYRNVIIQCYANMCSVLREHRRLERKHSMTPREFARRLEQMGISGWHAYRLTHLFEAVRYGDQSIERKDEEEAIECLTAITMIAERRSIKRLSEGDWKLEY